MALPMTTKNTATPAALNWKTRGNWRVGWKFPSLQQLDSDGSVGWWMWTAGFLGGPLNPEEFALEKTPFLPPKGRRLVILRCWWSLLCFLILLDLVGLFAPRHLEVVVKGGWLLIRNLKRNEESEKISSTYGFLWPELCKAIPYSI